MVEAEHAPCERAIPQQVVERGEQHRSARGRRVELRAGRDEDGRAAVLDGVPFECSLVDERVNDGSHARSSAPEAPVLDDAPFRQDSAPPYGPGDELTQPLGLLRRRRVEGLWWENALGEVVQALEALTARDHELAVVPEQLEHLLGRLPAPHLALARRSVEVA